MTAAADRECAHCGLPVHGKSSARGDAANRGGLSGADDPQTPVWCCIGCRLAASAAGGRGPAGFLDARLLVSAFLCMGVMEFTLVLYGDSLFAAHADDAATGLRALGRLALIAFSLSNSVMYFGSVKPFMNSTPNDWASLAAAPGAGI